MDKGKTSPRQKPSTLKPQKAKARVRGGNVAELDPVANLMDRALIGSAIMQCLVENDPDGVMEVIENHLYALNKSKFLKDANIPRSTLYQLLKRKNPTIKTLAKIMHAAHHP